MKVRASAADSMGTRAPGADRHRMDPPETPSSHGGGGGGVPPPAARPSWRALGMAAGIGVFALVAFAVSDMVALSLIRLVARG